MNKPILFAMVLAVAMTGAILLGAAGVVQASGRYPRAMQVVNERVEVLSGDRGIVSQVGSYRTSDALATVEAWYMSRYHIEPEPDIVAQGSCVRLAKVNVFGSLQQAVVVNLCSSVHGTEVDFDQRLYWRW